jgi:hypothetical protein
MSDNKRDAARRKALKSGKIILSKSSVLDCWITDLSETGARLALDGLTILPPEFRLRFVTTGQEVVAELVWHRGNKAGVRFT